jgi:putative glutamine amidotransferase
MSDITVNSLHHQGIHRLGDGLAIEAMAPDSTIEAVRVSASKAFALGLQWHPEFDCAEDDVSSKIFQAFGEAARGERHGMRLAAD